MKFVLEVHTDNEIKIKFKNVSKKRKNYKQSRHANRVNIQSICARLHTHPGVYKIPAFNLSKVI